MNVLLPSMKKLLMEGLVLAYLTLEPVKDITGKMMGREAPTKFCVLNHLNLHNKAVLLNCDGC